MDLQSLFSTDTPNIKKVKINGKDAFIRVMPISRFTLKTTYYEYVQTKKLQLEQQNTEAQLFLVSLSLCDVKGNFLVDYNNIEQKEIKPEEKIKDGDKEKVIPAVVETPEQAFYRFADENVKLMDNAFTPDEYIEICNQIDELNFPSDDAIAKN